MTLARCTIVALCVLQSACVGQAEPAPAALSLYLDELMNGRLSSAYERTQLAELGAFAQGGALSEQHFEALYRADPLISYEIVEVVRLDRRTVDNPGEQGTPEWEILVRMVHASGPVEASFGIVGEVLAQINVVPIAIDVLVPGGELEVVRIDGVPIDLSGAAVGEGGERWRVVVLAGRHRLRVDDVLIRFDAEPLNIVAGPGRAEGSASSGKPQTLRITVRD